MINNSNLFRLLRFSLCNSCRTKKFVQSTNGK